MPLSYLCLTYAPNQPKAATVVENPEWRMDLPEPVISSDCGADYIPLLTALKLGK